MVGCRSQTSKDSKQVWLIQTCTDDKNFLLKLLQYLFSPSHWSNLVWLRSGSHPAKSSLAFLWDLQRKSLSTTDLILHHSRSQNLGHLHFIDYAFLSCLLDQCFYTQITLIQLSNGPFPTSICVGFQWKISYISGSKKQKFMSIVLSLERPKLRTSIKPGSLRELPRGRQVDWLQVPESLLP